MSYVRLAGPEDIRDIALRMRESDYQEIVALTWVNGREALANYLVDLVKQSPGITLVYGQDRPIAIGCVLLIRPGVASFGFFATDDFKLVMPLLLRSRSRLVHLARELFPFHRLQTVALASQSARWITANSGKFESALPGYGRNGEDYNMYVWR
ncbi:putative N-acetyltransferase domain-containing protein [uncultured Gammaproteobacteria bacterium]